MRTTRRRTTSRRAADALDAEISAIYYAHCSGIVIPMLQIPSIFAAARAARERGEDMRAAIVARVDAIRCDHDDTGRRLTRREIEPPTATTLESSTDAAEAWDIDARMAEAEIERTR